MLRDVSSSAETGSMSVPNAARMQMRTAEAFPPMTALFTGTNIDLADFELLTQGVKSSKCSELKKQPNYFKIDLRRKAKGYDRIVAYYDKKKKCPSP